MLQCRNIEFVIWTAEQWRSMPDNVFEANLAALERALRAYHAATAAERARQPRLNIYFPIAMT